MINLLHKFDLFLEDINMKKIWNTPELQDLTISATANTDMQGCFDWWKPVKPGQPGKPGKPGKPGCGGAGGDEMSPSEFHPEEELS